MYERSAIAAAGPGETVDALRVNEVAAGSYIAIKDGTAYLGRYAQNPTGPFDDDDNEPELYTYDIGPGGVFSNESDPIRTPYHAQGLAVTDDGLLFSTSYGNTWGFSPHDLVFQEFDGSGDGVESAGDADDVVELEYYSEGINIIGDDVYVTYESGADQYDGEDGNPYIERIPLDDLDDY